jgi:hypothetical protein
MSKTSFTNWNEHATRLVKAEMALAGVGYEQLSKQLAEIGISESYKGLANKINRGTFSFAFYLQCLHCLRTDISQQSNIMKQDLEKMF